MFVHCLGVAAGGGYPQWNRACAGCRKARAKPEVATTHAGIAVSGNGEQWFLLNATPDVRPMGHLSVGGADGSARALAALPAKRKIYTHIDNTNPILDEESQERRRLTDSGIEVGRAGLEVEV